MNGFYAPMCTRRTPRKTAQKVHSEGSGLRPSTTTKGMGPGPLCGEGQRGRVGRGPLRPRRGPSASEFAPPFGSRTHPNSEATHRGLRSVVGRGDPRGWTRKGASLSSGASNKASKERAKPYSERPAIGSQGRSRRISSVSSLSCEYPSGTSRRGHGQVVAFVRHDPPGRRAVGCLGRPTAGVRGEPLATKGRPRAPDRRGGGHLCGGGPSSLGCRNPQTPPVASP